jgi:hypothetical protein
MLPCYPYLKLHINLLEVGESKRWQKLCYDLVRKYTPLSDPRVPFEEYKSELCFCLKKHAKTPKLLRCEIGKITLFCELFYLSTTQGNMLAKCLISYLHKECVGISLMYSCISWDTMFMIAFISICIQSLNLINIIWFGYLSPLVLVLVQNVNKR